jgi:hypothetical protein
LSKAHALQELHIPSQIVFFEVPYVDFLHRVIRALNEVVAVIGSHLFDVIHFGDILKTREVRQLPHPIFQERHLFVAFVGSQAVAFTALVFLV